MKKLKSWTSWQTNFDKYLSGDGKWKRLKRAQNFADNRGLLFLCSYQKATNFMSMLWASTCAHNACLIKFLSGSSCVVDSVHENPSQLQWQFCSIVKFHYSIRMWLWFICEHIYFKTFHDSFSRWKFPMIYIWYVSWKKTNESQWVSFVTEFLSTKRWSFVFEIMENRTSSVQVIQAPPNSNQSSDSIALPLEPFTNTFRGQVFGPLSFNTVNFLTKFIHRKKTSAKVKEHQSTDTSNKDEDKFKFLMKHSAKIENCSQEDTEVQRAERAEFVSMLTLATVQG